MEIKLYYHEGGLYGDGYEYILGYENGEGILFSERDGKIKYSMSYSGLISEHLSNKSLIIDVENVFQKHLFIDKHNNIIANISYCPHIHIKTLEEYKGDISDLKPFNKKLTLKNK